MSQSLNNSSDVLDSQVNIKDNHFDFFDRLILRIQRLTPVQTPLWIEGTLSASAYEPNKDLTIHFSTLDSQLNKLIFALDYEQEGFGKHFKTLTGDWPIQNLSFCQKELDNTLNQNIFLALLVKDKTGYHYIHRILEAKPKL